MVMARLISPTSSSSSVRASVAAVERSGASGDLELDHVARAESHHRPPGTPRGNAAGAAIAHHVEGIGAVVQAQRESQVGVGADVVVDHARRSLRREHEVHAEAAAPLGDPDQRRDEVGEIGRERRELVDDHDAAVAAAVSRRSPDVRRDRWRRTARSSRSRRCTSASRLTNARAASPSSRSVTTPTVCGRSAHASNVAPPL